MDIHIGDTLELRKPHPCGGKTFKVLRIGMDFKVECVKCGRIIMTPRVKLEKSIKKIIRENAKGDND